MNEFCHGFSTGKLLEASFLHCVNCSLNLTQIMSHSATL